MAQTIKPGQKIYIAYDVPLGKEPEFNMLCTFVEQIDEAMFKVTVPMDPDGNLIPMDDDKKLLMRVGSGQEMMIMAGYIDDEVTEGIRSYWLIRRVTELRQFLKRADERLKVTLHVQYMQDSWEPDDQGKIRPNEGITSDISAGGCALFLNRRFEIGEIVELFFPRVGRDYTGEALSYVGGAVCWYKEAPKGAGYRLLCGIQYRFEDPLERERMKIYVEAVRKANRIQS